MNMDEDNIKIAIQENNKTIDIIKQIPIELVEHGGHVGHVEQVEQVEQVEHVEPLIIDAIEHVPCCRKYCRKCCDEFIINDDNIKQCCQKCHETTYKKWIECGKNADEKCIHCCKLNFGVLFQNRCPQPCFEDCNKSAGCVGIIIAWTFFGLVFVSIIIVPDILCQFMFDC
jgi:hypothetical protein